MGFPLRGPAGLALGFVLTTSVVSAQGREASAEALFEEGKALYVAGKVAEACRKFADSHHLAPNGGTLTNLAECLEREGRTASAWLRYKELAARARAAGQPAAEQKASDQVTRLAASLPHLTVTVAAPDTPGLEVLRDGQPLDRAEWGVAVPIDPGARKLEARAPGKAVWTETITIPASRASIAATVPPLAALTSETVATDPAFTAPAPSATGGEVGRGQRIAGLATAGLGLVGTGLGIAFGLVAQSKNDEALEPANCPAETRCRPRGLELTEDARDAALLSTIGFVAGGALLVGGAVLYFTAPRSTSTRVGLRGAGFVLEGTFQ